MVLSLTLIGLLPFFMTSLALPTVNTPSSMGNTSTTYTLCFGHDSGSDIGWRRDCDDVIDRLERDAVLPVRLQFGTSGFASPWYYPLRFTTGLRCEIRVELISGAWSDTIDKFEVGNFGNYIIDCCIDPDLGTQYLGGFVKEIGRQRNLQVSIGRSPSQIPVVTEKTDPGLPNDDEK